MGYRGTIYKLNHDQMKPQTTGLRPVERGRARIQAAVWNRTSCGPGRNLRRGNGPASAPWERTAPSRE